MYFEDEKDIIDENANLHIADDGTVSWEDILSDSDSTEEDGNTSDASESQLDADIADVDSVNIDDFIQDDADTSSLEYIDNTSDNQSDFDSSGDAIQSINNAETYSQEENFTEDFDIDKQLEKVSFDENSTENNSDFRMPPKDAKKLNSTPILIALLVAVLVMAGIYYYFTSTQNPNEPLVSPSTKTEMDNMTPEKLEDRANDLQETEEIAEDQSASIPVVNDENIDTLKADEVQLPEKKQVISIIPTGRINPFMPIQKYDKAGIDDTVIQYDKVGIPTPPIKMGVKDEETVKMLTISVSGIMYDDVKPSAIITLDNNDYFVQKGDMLDNYKVIDIGRNFVTVAHDKNLFKANVGEEFKISSKFYGSAQYIPQGQGGGRQYYSVAPSQISRAPSKKTTFNSSRLENVGSIAPVARNEKSYVSEDDIDINKK